MAVSAAWCCLRDLRAARDAGRGRRKRAACPRFSPRLKIAAFNPCISERLCYNDSNPNQLRTAMANTRNFSDPEKRQAMDRLHIPTTSTPPARLQAYPSRLAQKPPDRQNATLSEKGFPMSDKRTMSDILLIYINNPIPSRLLPTPPAKTPIMPITTGVAHAIDMTTSTLPSKNLCALCGESPGLESGICPVSLKFTSPNDSGALILSLGLMSAGHVASSASTSAR